jgi:hypothetical protein
MEQLDLCMPSILFEETNPKMPREAATVKHIARPLLYPAVLWQPPPNELDDSNNDIE